MRRACSPLGPNTGSIMIVLGVLALAALIVISTSTGLDLASRGDTTGSDVQWGQIRLDGKRVGLFVAYNSDNITAKYPGVMTLLSARGAVVTSITNAMLPVGVTSSVLANYDIVWFDEADGGNKFSSAELTAIRTWVTNGGSALCLGDESSSPAEDVSDYLGPYWTSFYSNTGTTTNIYAHPISQGVTSIWVSGYTWMPTPTSDGSVSVVRYGSFDDIVAAQERGSGKAVFICDDDIFMNLGNAQNELFVQNVFGWLAYRNNNPPGLVADIVSPGSGTQATAYNFSVTYMDPDNNEPEYVRLHVNGSVHDMVKAVPGHHDYVGGVTYYFQRTLQPGNHSFSFTCSDGGFTNTTVVHEGPEVSYSSLAAPVLEGAKVDKLEGDHQTVFNFSVTYRDPDNNQPEFVTITINATTVAMVESDPSVREYTAGKAYHYLTTVPVGHSVFQINCSDGTYHVSTDWLEGPVVNPFLAGTQPKTRHVAIFQDIAPWGYNVIAPMLAANGITYTFFTSAQLATTPLAPYDKVLVPSNQNNLFYSRLVDPAVRAKIEAYVSAGGVFQMHVGHYVNLYDIPGVLPGGYTDVETIYHTHTMSASFLDHPLLKGITNDGIDNWVDSSGGYMQNMSGDEKVLIYTDSGSRPALFTRRYGAGELLYTHLLLEWAVGHGYGDSHQLLKNMLRYSDFNPYPADHGSVFTGDVNFTWNSMNEAFSPINYTWQLSGTSDFAMLIDEVSRIPETPGRSSLLRTIDLPSDTYYWRLWLEHGPFNASTGQIYTFTLIENHEAPQLSLAQVDPGVGGDQSNIYNFTVVYTDADNNPPYWVNVSLNGTHHPMVKVDPGANDFAGGVLYSFTSLFQPGLVAFSFHAFDGKYLAATGNQTVSVGYSNLAPPSLVLLPVVPATGNNQTTFRFVVSYTDPDNNLPHAINITINGTVLPMLELDPLDMNATDGKLYVVDLILPVHGRYEYFASCWDGDFLNTTAVVQGPEVNPFAPDFPIKNVAVLQNQNPWGYPILTTTLAAKGIAYTVFPSSAFETFSLASYDKVLVSSNQPEAFYNALTLPGTRAWLEAYVLAGGILEIHGATGSLSVSGLPFGYGWQYNLVNALSINASFSGHPIVAGVTNESIDNWGYSAHVRILNVNSGDEIIIYDDNNLHPRMIVSQVGSGQVILTGMTLEYGAANGIQGASKLLENMLEYGAPAGRTVMLVAPAAGHEGFNGAFNFTWVAMHYTVPDPTYTLQVAADAGFSMVIDEWPGVPHVPGNISLLVSLDYDTGTYHWRVRPEYNDLVGNWSTSRQLLVIRNDHAPTLVGGVDPPSGDQDTLFTFTVTYTDADDNAPLFVHLTINGTTIPMVKQEPADLIYSDGCIYNHSMKLLPGTYLYHFSTADGRFTNQTVNFTLVVLEISLHAPTLTSVNFTPSIGDNLTVFHFSVIYTDEDNNLPRSINITINGVTHDMHPVDVQDFDVTDGKGYYFATRIDTFGPTQFEVQCSDPAFNTSTGVLAGPDTNPFHGTYNFTPVNKVLVFKDSDPWGGTPIENVLTKHGIPYIVRDRFSLDSIAYWTSQGYEKMIIASEQGSTFNSRLQSNMASLDTFVRNGGILQVHASQLSSTARTYFGGYATVRLDRNQFSINGTYLYHPILQGVNITNFTGFSPLSNGYITGIKSGDHVLVYDTLDGNANTIAIPHGNGYLILTCLRVERAYVNGNPAMLEQMILYGRRNPIPFLPANNSIAFNGDVSFSWKSMGSGNLNYTFQLSSDPAFSTILSETEGITETAGNTTHVLPIFTPGTYHWRVLPHFAGFSWTWTPRMTFTLVINDHAPTLSEDSVSPLLGDSNTYINFSVRYTDLDNNTPTIARVRVGIFSHTMSKTTPSDNDFTDGVVYSWYWKYGNNNYTVYFEFSDGKTTVTTTPKQLVIMDLTPPALLNPQVSPSTGNTSTSFTFTVEYWDSRNEIPSSITVTINGSTRAMVQVDPSDTTTVDGKLYHHVTTLVDFGTYRFRCNASNSMFSTWTDWTDGPVVSPFGGYEDAITLLGPANGSTVFNGVVSFSWTSIEPGFSPITYQWQSSASPGFDPVNHQVLNIPETPGFTSINVTMDYPTSTHYWRVRPEYQGMNGEWSDIFVVHVKRNDHAPGLTSLAVSPGTGNLSTTFNFTVVYTDVDGDLPVSITVSINGTVHAMVEADPADLNTVDGKVYFYTGNLDDFGQYRFMVECSDGRYASATAWIDGPLVTPFHGYVGVTLLAPANATMMTTGTHEFSWGSLEPPFGPVHYTLQVSDSPVFATIIVEESNIAETPSITSVNITLDLVTKIYHWRACPVHDGIRGAWSEPFTFHFFRNDYAPVLNGSSVDPPLGNLYQPFSFMIVYSDADNNEPAFVNITIGGNSHVMSKLVPSDVDYTDGCVFTFTTILDAGEHAYFFSTSDGIHDFQTSPLVHSVQPNINTPSLSNASFSPGRGNFLTMFVFSVTYTDIDGNLPRFVNITINGTTHAMMETSPADTDVTDGKAYRLSLSFSVAGTYQFTVSCSDWHFNATTVLLTGPEVNPIIGHPVAVLLQPGVGDLVSKGFHAFSWASLKPGFGPVLYTWQFSSTPDFTTIVKQVENIPEGETTTSVNVMIDHPGGEYYWRVIPVYLGVEGTPSPPRLLNIQSTSPMSFLEDYWLVLLLLIAGIAVGVAGFTVARKKSSQAKQDAKQAPRTKKVPGVTPDLIAGKPAGAKKVGVEAPVRKHLTPEELQELQQTEQEVTARLDVKTCIVHKGPIKGANYACPHCNTFYCLNCVLALANAGELCWSCGKSLELDDSLKAIPVARGKTDSQARFYCESCNEYHVIETPDFGSWEACPACGKQLVLVKACPSCKNAIAINKDLHDTRKGRFVQCSSCGASVPI